MLAAYTELKNAQKVKNFLVAKKLTHPDYLVVKELGYIYFPIVKKMKVPKAKVVNTKFKFPKKEKHATIDELLKGKLTAKEMKLIPRSLEVVGKIMVLEVPDELKKKEKLIAQAYLKQNHNIETVVKKDKIHSGEFRLRKVKILAGKRSKETIHFENGVKIKLDLEKTYFSARSANERLRIARLVKPKEEVLVMFSGAAPFPLVIAKNSSAKLIYGIEMNSLAHQYALTNVSLNRLDSRVAIFNGDVRDLLPKVRKKFDRISMPLPKTGDQFLGLALKKIKDNGVVHLYDFLSEAEFAVVAKNIREICKKNKKRCRILRKVKCGQFSPSVYRVCFDIMILRK
jgi:tRNA (guanine37-N1)-methyltransferase